MLDTNRPHYEICGNVGYAGAKWEQDGRFYDKAGKFLGPGKEPAPPKPKESEEVPCTFPSELRITSKKRWEIIPQFEGWTFKEIEKLHIQSLRRIMIKNGQKYKSKAHALEYLK